CASARGRGAAVLRNQRQVRGPRGWLRERRDAYRVFAAFARSMTESLEQWGTRPPPLVREVPDPALFRDALAEGRGLVVPTAHFSGWDIGARFLSDLGRPVNLVVAPEPTPTTREFMHRLRTRFGFNIIYSGRSIFTALPIRQALHRNEVVGMQIDPWGRARCARAPPPPSGGGRWVTAARPGAPLVPVFTGRPGVRHYQMRTAGRFDP